MLPISGRLIANCGVFSVLDHWAVFEITGVRAIQHGSWHVPCPAGWTRRIGRPIKPDLSHEPAGDDHLQPRVRIGGRPTTQPNDVLFLTHVWTTTTLSTGAAAAA